MDRMVSLTVGTTGAEDYMRIYQDVSELARNMVDTHEYVNVSAQVVGASGDDEPDTECKLEHLYYDENTLIKAHRAIKDILPNVLLDTHAAANEILLNLQNAGLLFRERSKPASEQLLLPLPVSHR